MADVQQLHCPYELNKNTILGGLAKILQQIRMVLASHVKHCFDAHYRSVLRYLFGILRLESIIIKLVQILGPNHSFHLLHCYNRQVHLRPEV